MSPTNEALLNTICVVCGRPLAFHKDSIGCKVPSAVPPTPLACICSGLIRDPECPEHGPSTVSRRDESQARTDLATSGREPAPLASALPPPTPDPLAPDDAAWKAFFAELGFGPGGLPIKNADFQGLKLALTAAYKADRGLTALRARVQETQQEIDVRVATLLDERIAAWQCGLPKNRFGSTLTLAEYEAELAAHTAREARLTEALKWLAHLCHDVGRAGGNPESGEWEAATIAGEAALSPSAPPTEIQ